MWYKITDDQFFDGSLCCCDKTGKIICAMCYYVGAEHGCSISVDPSEFEQVKAPFDTNNKE